MKNFLFVPACAIVAACALTSCQKEDKSVVTLAKELTTELRTVIDHPTAEAAAPRVKVLNKRLMDAMARTCTLNENALRRSVGKEGQEAAELVTALDALAREVARVRASLPVTSYDGEVDEDQLVMAVGASTTEGSYKDADATRREAGSKYLQEDAIDDHKEPPPFAECYGSEALKEALSYTVTPADVPVMRFDSAEDVVAVPDKAPVSEDLSSVAEEGESADEAADDADKADADSSDEPADSGEADSTDADSGSSESSDDSSSDDSGSDDSSSDDSLDIGDIPLDLDI
ncbi:MAG TPA: hypothetical protein H9976_07480 [Candidatus Akkermansia intestinavium]|nr:hypothetical protein [Candidatus Akkermansia intestinavium]